MLWFDVMNSGNTFMQWIHVMISSYYIIPYHVIISLHGSTTVGPSTWFLVKLQETQAGRVWCRSPTKKCYIPIMLYYHIILHRIIAYYIISNQIKSKYFISYHIHLHTISYYNITIIAYTIRLYHGISVHIILWWYHVISYHMMCDTPFILSYTL